MSLNIKLTFPGRFKATGCNFNALDLMAYIIKNDLIFNNLVMYSNVLLKIISKWHGKSFLFDLRNIRANFQAGV